jgi:hypothetical protein
MAVGVIHREDVADLVVRTLESPFAERKVLTAVDPTIASALNADGRKVDEFVLV